MKKLTITLIAVFALSSILFAQRPEINKSVRMDKNPSFQFLDLPIEKSVKEISSDAIMPEAFRMGCCNLPTDLMIYTEPIPLPDGSTYTEVIVSNNIYGSVRLGQTFKLSSENTINSVQAYMRLLRDGENANIYANIYELGSDGLASKLIATSNAVLTSSISKEQAVNLVNFSFSSPIEVPQNFVIAIELPEWSATGLRLAILTSPQKCLGSGAEDFAMAFYLEDVGGTDGEWITYNELYGLGENGFELAIFANGEDLPAPTNLQSSDVNNYNIYPNPATDIIYIENAADSKVRMIDATGKVVLERAIQNSRENIEINHLQKGMYFMEINGQEGKSVNKVIKQ